MNGKKISPQKRIGQLGINLIERIVLRMGHKWQQTNSELDTGIDGVIEICDPSTAEATNCVIQVQSKSLQHFTAETDSGFEFLCDERDLNHWLMGNTPVILVVSRSGRDEAYWVDVKRYFSDLSLRPRRRIAFDKTRDCFTETCSDALRQIAIPRDAGLFSGPVPREETLITNLLPVQRHPTSLFVAETPIRRNGDLWFKAKTEQLKISAEWILTSKQILSVHNLRENPWNQFCDPGTVEEFGAEEWAESDDEQRVNQYRELLFQCLRERLFSLDVAYHRGLDLLYFRATRDLKARTLPYPALKQLTAREVFGPQVSSKTHRLFCYRHSACICRFRRFDGLWHLELTPTYYFSWDGYRESRYAPDRLKGIKRLERNAAVLGQLLMWTECVTQGDSLFHKEYPHLAFGKPGRFMMQVGVDDGAWLAHEEDTRGQEIRSDLDDARLFPS